MMYIFDRISRLKVRTFEYIVFNLKSKAKEKSEKRCEFWKSLLMYDFNTQSFILKVEGEEEVKSKLSIKSYLFFSPPFFQKPSFLVFSLPL